MKPLSRSKSDFPSAPGAVNFQGLSCPPLKNVTCYDDSSDNEGTLNVGKSYHSSYIRLWINAYDYKILRG